MKFQWISSLYSQQVLVTLTCLLIIISRDVASSSRILRRLKHSSIDPLSINLSDPDQVSDPDRGRLPSPPFQSTTKSIDLIPQVDGLSFVDEAPSVLRFYSDRSPDQQTTDDLAWGPIDTIRLKSGLGTAGDGEAFVDRPSVSSSSSSYKDNVQRVVAGVSFVGGLVVSLSVCLVCCRIRGRCIGSRIFDGRRNDAGDVISSVATTEQSDVKDAL